jgi:arsenate reductase
MKILFLCTGNACRSQIAEAWANALKSESIEAYSAGVSPHGLDARAVEVMGEAGIDMTKHRSKDVKELLHIHFDAVITVCDQAAEVCSIFPGKSRIFHHGFEDPPRLVEGLAPREALNACRQVRDDIKAFVETLPDCLIKEKEWV